MPERLSNQSIAAKIHLLVVIVLYKLSADESSAFNSLQLAMSQIDNERTFVKVVLYDNSPLPGTQGMLPKNVVYRAASTNSGVSGAYSCALDMAISEGYTWLLTLDQDTTLPVTFLNTMAHLASQLYGDTRVAAIVPHLFDKGRLLSPATVHLWGVKTLPVDFTGIANRETTALNSGSLFRVSALRQIGGFSRDFWLDFLDTWTYHQLYRHGKHIYVAKGVYVEHELSVLDLESRVPSDRFNNILQAETSFNDIYEGRLRGMALTARLLFRLYRQKRRGNNIAIRHITRDQLKRRIFCTKQHRISDWLRQMEDRRNVPLSPPTTHVLEERPSISVCMAAFNGEKYISAQIASILAQLKPKDELVIVDDSSTDGTRDIIRSFLDSRIRLIKHAKNCGVLQSFEDALRAASGSILFLSDQDDLWAPAKVATILDAFKQVEGVTLIATEASSIDADGKLLLGSFFSSQYKFSSGFWANLLQSRFCGCTMAFRAEILSDVLPLPHEYEVLHDIWIGVRSSLSGHRTLHIDKPLVLYRRHESTVTGRGKLSVMKRFRIRLDLLRALIDFFIRQTIRLPM